MKIIIYQLPLPKDIVDYMCSFIYCTLEQSISRNKQRYHVVLCDLFYTVRLHNFYNWNNLNVTVFIYNLQSNFDIQFVICCKCGNYTNMNCNCNLSFNSINIS
jgi:hypothetical protein